MTFTIQGLKQMKVQKDAFVGPLRSESTGNILRFLVSNKPCLLDKHFHFAIGSRNLFFELCSPKSSSMISVSVCETTRGIYIVLYSCVLVV